MWYIMLQTAAAAAQLAQLWHAWPLMRGVDTCIVATCHVASGNHHTDVGTWMQRINVYHCIGAAS